MTGPVLFLALLAVFGATTAALYWYFQTRRKPVRTAVYTGCILGILRAILASVGWYAVEHTGGPLQVPAFALAMLAWPEAMVFAERHTTPAPQGFYLRLSLLLVTSTAVNIGLIGAVATLRRKKGPHRPQK